MQRSTIVCLSICRSLCHDREPRKNRQTDWDVVWDVDSGGSKEARLRWRCTLAPAGEYDWTVHVRWRCGLFVKLLWPLVFASPNEGCDTLRSTCLLCLFVCLCVLAYLKSHMSTLQEIFCMRYLWPGLDPPLTTMQYFMHVRFRGYRHVFTHIVGQIQTQAIGE